jgi:hypothetical protein
MPILPSRAGDIQELVRRLGSERAAERDAAAARLRLLGERALPALTQVLRGRDRRARSAALQALEGQVSRRALAPVLGLCEDADPEVARAAIEWIAANPGPGVPEALDALLAVLLDERRPDAQRLAAFEVVPGLADRERRAVLGQLRATRSRALAARVEALTVRSSPSGPQGLAALHRALAESSDPAELGRLLGAVARHHSPASLPVLRRLLDRLGAAADAGRAHAELAARVHGVLSAMGSRIALYDLRERLARRPVPAAAALLAAAARVGDASLVPVLAAVAADVPRLVPECSRAFRAIAAREKLGPRSAALRAVRPEHRTALDALRERRRR